MTLPKITVVTPSFNQSGTLEDTILSVIGQCYPNLEYMVLDGGSSDGSLEIIQKYEEHLAYWVSAPDGGQTAAINEGFRRATGDILAWLNSDDMYLPGALAHVAAHLDPRRAELLFGNCLSFRPADLRAWGSDVRAGASRHNLLLADYVPQSSTFWTRATWDALGPLAENLNFGFDWEWFIRAHNSAVSCTPDDRHLSIMLWHPQQKTTSGGDVRRRELESIYRTHAGPRYADLYARCCRRRAAILRTRLWVRRLRLQPSEGRVFKATFPLLFRGFPSNEVADIIAMV